MPNSKACSAFTSISQIWMAHWIEVQKGPQLSEGTLILE